MTRILFRWQLVLGAQHDLRAGDEREGWLDLVEPASLQHLGEGDAGRADADQHLVGAGLGLGDVDDLDRRRPVERGDLNGAHETTVVRGASVVPCGACES